jgi:hypothetical protein
MREHRAYSAAVPHEKDMKSARSSLRTLSNALGIPK